MLAQRSTAERSVIDVAALPEVVFGHRALTWWGTVGFAVIEGWTLALCVVSYFYLRRNFVEWPPLGTRNPSLLIPTINLVLMLVSLAPAEWIKRKSRELDTRAVTIGLIICSLFAIVFCVLRWYEFTALNTRWDSNAYGSAAWTTVGFHATLLIVEAAEVLGVTAIFLTRRVEEKHYADAEDVALYWYFLIGSWIPIYVILYLLPRWW